MIRESLGFEKRVQLGHGIILILRGRGLTTGVSMKNTLFGRSSKTVHKTEKIICFISMCLKLELNKKSIVTRILPFGVALGVSVPGTSVVDAAVVCPPDVVTVVICPRQMSMKITTITKII